MMIKHCIEHCVVRTYKKGYSNPTTTLQGKLSAGWMVKFITPFTIGGDTEYVEYILERQNSIGTEVG